MARPMGKTPVSRLAKLSPPHLPVVLNRTRLFHQLDQATKSPLTWLAAPPGAGKTTLLASYLQMRARKSIWYRLDAGDADPSTLFHYLGLAVQSAAPRFRTRLPHLTPEYMAGLSIFTRRFFEQLGSRFPHPTVIVLDNYHEVAPDSLIHQLLPVGIQQLPSHARVIVLSREGVPSGYARLQAEQQIHAIKAEELELTREEARQLGRLRHAGVQINESLSSIDHAWELSKGWLAGFILMLQQSQWEPAFANVDSHRGSQAIFDYFAGEVFARFPQDSQTFLLTVSVLSDFTPLMAQELSAVPNATSILEQLHQAHYFVERREDRIGWYRFHPLFQEFLLRRVERTWHPTALEKLRRNAAALLVENHQEEQAIALLQQAHAWNDYRALIRGQAPILVRQGRMQTLQTWIQYLPNIEREADPWMAFWVADCRLLVAPQEATPLFELVMPRFQQQGDQTGMLLSWAGAAQSILVAATGMKRIHNLMRLFEEIHPEGTAYPSLEVEAVVAQAMAGCYVFMYPDQPQTRMWLDRAVEFFRILPSSLRGHEIVMLTFYYILQGEGDKVQALFSHQQRVWANDASVTTRVMLLIAESMSLWYSGQAEDFRSTVRESLDIAEREGLLVWNGILYAQVAHLELMVGNTKVARDHLELMLPFARFGANKKIYLGLSGWADLAEGNIDRVWQKCQQAWDIIEAEGSPMFLIGGHYLLESQALRMEGRQTEAEELLAKVEVIAQVLPWYFRFSVLFLRAQWAFQDGDEERGTTWLRRLVKEGKKSPLIGIGWSPQEAAQLLAKALELNLEVSYVREVIQKWQLKPPADVPVPENWPWRVKIHTFGKLVVEVDGKPLEKNRKAPHRLLELLVAVIAFGGDDVSVSRLIDALWPEVEGDTAHENFKKTLSRLRKLLAVDDAILWQDGKLSLNRDLCWVDVLAFEKHAKQEDARAVGLYKGPLLGLEEIPIWAESQREQARSTFIRLMNRHCDQVQTEEKAIHSLEQAIAVDPLVEPLYQRLIPLLTSQGRHTDAQRHYRTCVKACQQWRNGDLSPETRRLGKSLTH